MLVGTHEAELPLPERYPHLRRGTEMEVTICYRSFLHVSPDNVASNLTGSNDLRLPTPTALFHALGSNTSKAK
jgi:hypothetical protein